MLEQLNKKKWHGPTPGWNRVVEYTSKDAAVFRCADGNYRVFSVRVCHPGIVVNSVEQINAAERWLRNQHRKNRKLCSCEVK